MTELDEKYIWPAYEKDNYQCIDTGAKSQLCYIFFSSNGLYFPDEEKVFQEQIIQKDRYEWKWVVSNSRIPMIAGRIIYVRDVFKDWYSKGISRENNTIEKTVQLLKNLTEGYRIVTVGSSAGGYMAVLTAVMLKAELCFNFSGQYVLREQGDRTYRNITKLLENFTGSIMYFVPAYCEQDQVQYNMIKNIPCIKEVLFNGHKHAETMFAGNMSYIVDQDQDQLYKIYKTYKGKKVDKIKFLFDTVPFGKAICIMRKEIGSFINRRMGKYVNDI